ncbi:hypothetical protein B0T25DRAFT_126458 [Lasiosphaeria hispida]|uniref:Secreted protein n=1 Tax=Lasiosphaeria hispida TaxID=260671 RepID=A0AAJ0HS24_9PEZI|nr:hypothetical protein B0T25DRAFT_126458 [Lasiosphaeria hispida]
MIFGFGESRLRSARLHRFIALLLFSPLLVPSSSLPKFPVSTLAPPKAGANGRAQAQGLNRVELVNSPRAQRGQTPRGFALSLIMPLFASSPTISEGAHIRQSPRPAVRSRTFLVSHVSYPQPNVQLGAQQFRPRECALSHGLEYHDKMSGVGFALVHTAPRLLSMPPIIHAILGQCNGVPGVGSLCGGPTASHGAWCRQVWLPRPSPSMCPVLLRIRTAALYIVRGKLLCTLQAVCAC